MPELPDLQAFCRNLSKTLAGRELKKLHAIYKKKLKTPEWEIKEALEGARLTAVDRDGKELCFVFDNGNVLALHMMLRGQLQYFEKINHHKFTMLELLFDNGVGIAMTDVMKQAILTLNPKARTAPDALSKSVDYLFLKETLGRSKLQVKKLLIDQNTIRGIGNAYADEILWHAGISPFSISNKVPEGAIHKLAKSIKAVFTKAENEILKVAPDIIGGEIRDFMLIHHPDRTHSPTGGEIMKVESGGRKTYYTKEQQLWE